MNRPSRSMRKLLDAVATNNEAAALDVMRAAEQLQDEVLRQRLLNLIHRLNQDANDLRMARDDIQGFAPSTPCVLRSSEAHKNGLNHLTYHSSSILANSKYIANFSYGCLA